ncbi:uncharacterized protein RBU33_015231 [Hipposideros larvatus]
MNQCLIKCFSGQYRTTVGFDFFAQVMQLEGQTATVQILASWQAEFLRQADLPNPAKFTFVMLGNKIDLPGQGHRQTSEILWVLLQTTAIK